MSFHKNPPLRSEAWKDAVRSLGYCVRCKAVCQPQCAHRNEGKGKSMKVSDAECAALCAICHPEIDQGRTMTRAERRAELDRCIVLTHSALADRGILLIAGQPQKSAPQLRSKPATKRGGSSLSSDKILKHRSPEEIAREQSVRNRAGDIDMTHIPFRKVGAG